VAVPVEAEYTLGGERVFKERNSVGHHESPATTLRRSPPYQKATNIDEGVGETRVTFSPRTPDPVLAARGFAIYVKNETGSLKPQTGGTT